MRAVAWVTILFGFLAWLGDAAASPDAPLDAAAATERGRGLDRILDIALGSSAAAPSEGRVLLLLLDPTPALAKAEFPSRLAEAMQRAEADLAATRIGVATVGGQGRPLLRPTLDHALVRRTVEEVCAAPRTSFQNVYADVRRVLATLRKEPGSLELVLVTLENGDAEDDLEETVRALERADVRCSVVAREAFLSDTWWAIERPKGGRDLTFTGAEGPFLELPWGLRYQGVPGNATVPSGYAMYGLTRLAVATGGRVFLYYPADESRHECISTWYGHCPFCQGDHEPPTDVYQSHRLRALAPLAVSRREASEIAARDPYFRAVLEAWEKCERYGIVYSRPSLRRTSEGVRLETNPYAGWGPLGYTTAFASEIAHARRLRQSLAIVTRELEDGIARAEASGGLERFRAVADTLRVLLEVTNLNLLLFEAFCREVGPVQERARSSDYEPPEIAPYPDDSRFRFVHYRSLSLCHGPKPFRNLRLPGGEATEAALGRLIEVWEPFERRYAHTPWLVAARRTGIARFHLVVDPHHVPWGRRVPGSKDDDTVTLPERPKRPGRPTPSGGSTGGGGATTGG